MNHYYFGDSFDLLNLRRMLLRLREEKNFVCWVWLRLRVDRWVAGLTQPARLMFLGPSLGHVIRKRLLPWSSKKTTGFLLDPVFIDPSSWAKRECPVVFTVNQPKFMFKPKFVSGPHPKEASLGFNEPWSNPNEFLGLFLKEPSLGSGVVQPGNLGALSSSLKGDSSGLRPGSARRLRRLDFC